MSILKNNRRLLPPGRCAASHSPEGCKKDRRLPVFFVALEVLLSNKFMEDLDRLWALRPWIPDPNDPSTWK